MRTYKIMAVPEPMLLVKGNDNIEKFLSIKPNIELIVAAKKRVAKFNKYQMDRACERTEAETLDNEKRIDALLVEAQMGAEQPEDLLDFNEISSELRNKLLK